MFDTKTGNEYYLAGHEIAPVIGGDFHMYDETKVWNIGCIEKVITAGRTLFDINETHDKCGRSPFKERNYCEEIIIGLVFSDGHSLSLIVEAIGYTELMTAIIANQKKSSTTDTSASHSMRKLNKEELLSIIKSRANFRLFMQLIVIYILSVVFCLSDWLDSTYLSTEKFCLGIVILTLLTFIFNYKSRMTKYSYFKDKSEKDYYLSVNPH